MEHQYNAHHIRQVDFWDFTSDLEIIYPKCVHLLNLTDQNSTFAPIYRKSTTVESKSF